MRKIPLFLFSAFLLFSLSGCSDNAKGNSEIQQAEVMAETNGNENVTVAFTEKGLDATTQAGTPVFDFETETVMLNSGYEIPINGLGTYSLLGDECVTSVTEALHRGVRLIDTAYMYHNEAQVGEAIRNSGIPREEIFVITKLYPSQFANAEANDVIPYIQSLGIVVQGWYQLGGRGHTAELLGNEVISQIAQAHGKSDDKKNPVTGITIPAVRKGGTKGDTLIGAIAGDLPLVEREVMKSAVNMGASIFIFRQCIRFGSNGQISVFDPAGGGGNGDDSS